MSETIFQAGSTFPSIAGSTICLNGEKELKRMKIAILKTKIIDYLKSHDKVRISDLSELFDVKPRLVGQALHELEEEGRIKEVD